MCSAWRGRWMATNRKTTIIATKEVFSWVDIAAATIKPTARPLSLRDLPGWPVERAHERKRHRDRQHRRRSESVQRRTSDRHPASVRHRVERGTGLRDGRNRTQQDMTERIEVVVPGPRLDDDPDGEDRPQRLRIESRSRRDPPHAARSMRTTQLTAMVISVISCFSANVHSPKVITR